MYNLAIAYAVLAVYLFGVCASGLLGAILNFRGSKRTGEKVMNFVQHYYFARCGSTVQCSGSILACRGSTPDAVARACMRADYLHSPIPQVREHYVAGAGLAQIAWFFTMAASLFSGYTVSG